MGNLERVFLLVAGVSVTLAFLSAGPSYAKKPPAQQFVNVAPLPGAGFALDAQGKPDGQGALQINIPIAYTPGNEFVNFGAYAGEFTRDWDKKLWVNGSGFVALGFFGRPRVYASGMAVSTWFSNDSKALSFQVQVVEESKNVPAIAIGAQDVLNKEGPQFGSIANTGVSYFGVMTKGFTIGRRKIYGSIGYGSARFEDTVFYGASLPLNNLLTLTVENDGFQFNEGIAWRPWGRHSHATFTFGYNDKAGPLFGLQFTGKIPSFWGIPIYLAMRQHG